MLRNNTLRDDDQTRERILGSAESRREHVIAAAVGTMTSAYADPEITQQPGLVPDVYNAIESVQSNLGSTNVAPNVVPLFPGALIDAKSAAPQASINEAAA